MIEDDSTAQEPQETASGQDETTPESATQDDAGNDGKTESTGTGSLSAQPSGGDTDTGEVGNGQPPALSADSGTTADTASGNTTSTMAGDSFPLLTDQEMAEVVWSAMRELARVSGDSSRPIWGMLDTATQVELIEHVSAIRSGLLSGHPLATAIVYVIDDNPDDLADDE